VRIADVLRLVDDLRAIAFDRSLSDGDVARRVRDLPRARRRGRPVTEAAQLDRLRAQLDHDAGAGSVVGFGRQVFIDALLDRGVADALAVSYNGKPGRPRVEIHIGHPRHSVPPTRLTAGQARS
jgi:hypothetical protein